MFHAIKKLISFSLVITLIISLIDFSSYASEISAYPSDDDQNLVLEEKLDLSDNQGIDDSIDEAENDELTFGDYSEEKLDNKIEEDAKSDDLGQGQVYSYEPESAEELKEGADREYIKERNMDSQELESEEYGIQLLSEGGLEGEGSESNPYLIYSYADFDFVITNNTSGIYYKLMSDIDMNGKKFKSLGPSSHPFEANFDGNNHKIFNIGGIYSKWENATDSNYAIFGCTKNCIIKNLGVVIKDNALSNIEGAGSIFMNTGTNVNVENCYVIGDFITTGDAGYAALIATSFSGTISKCYVQGKVHCSGQSNLTGPYAYAGGMIGGTSGKTTIKNSLAFVDVSYSGLATPDSYHSAGGLCGYGNSLSVENCLVVGKMRCESGYTKGQIYCGTGTPTVKNSFFLSSNSPDVSKEEYGTAKTLEELRDKSTYTSWDFTNTWVIDNNKNSGLPMLKSMVNLDIPLANVIAPCAINYSSVSGQTILSSDFDVDVTFDRPIIPVGNDKIFFRESSSNEIIPCSYNRVSDNVLRVTLTGKLTPGKKYNLVLGEGSIQDENLPSVFNINEDASYIINSSKQTFKGDGSIENPYQIETVYQLNCVQYQPSKNYVLANDIDASVTSVASIGEKKSGINAAWGPNDSRKGGERDPFTGTFDGKGYTIRGIKAYSGCHTTGDGYDTTIGLFASVKGGSIKNLNIVLSDEFTKWTRRTGTIVSYNYVSEIAGLVGIGSGEIINCSVSGNFYAKQQGTADIGLLAAQFSGHIERCYTKGTIETDGSDIGGLVGELKKGGSIKNCYSMVDIIFSGSRTAGGLVGRNGGTIENSYSAGSITNNTNSGGLVGISTGTVIDSYYDKELSQKTDEGKGTHKATEQMKSEETFYSWDLENTWTFEDAESKNEGYLYLIGTLNNVYLESNKKIVQRNITDRIRLDGKIVGKTTITLDSIDKDKTYISEQNGNNRIKVKSISVNGKSFTVKPSQFLSPNTNYILTIDSDAITYSSKKNNVNIYKYTFKTNNLTESAETFSVPDDAVKREYAKKWLGIADDRDSLPLPSKTKSEYINLFKMWMDYCPQDIKLTDDDISRILDMPYSALITTTDKSIYKDGDVKKTVMDCMRDILMIQYLKEKLIDEEESLLSDLTEERFQKSAKNMNEIYQRFMEYSNSGDKDYDPYTVYTTLVEYGLLFEEVLPKQIANPFKKSIKILDINKKAEKATSELITSRYTTSDSFYEAKEGLDLLKKLKGTGHLAMGIINYKYLDPTTAEMFDLLTGTDLPIVVGDQVGFNIWDESLDFLHELAGGDTSSLEWSIAKESIDFVKDFGLATLKDGNVALMVPLKMMEVYYKTALHYLSFIKDQCPTWLFYSSYYMKNEAPDIYNKIWRGRDLPLLEYDDGYLPDDYAKESNAIIKHLMNPLQSVPLIESMYLPNQLKTYSQNNDIYKIVDAASYLGQIRVMNQEAIAKALMYYSINEYNVSKTKKKVCIVACPTDIDIIDEATGDCVLQIHNNMEVGTNFGEFGSVYLSGENRDVKHIILNSGYSLKINPTDNGEMTCVFADTIGNEMEYVAYYNDIPISLEEEYEISAETTDLIKTSQSDDTIILPDEVKGFDSKPSDDNNNDLSSNNSADGKDKDSESNNMSVGKDKDTNSNLSSVNKTVKYKVKFNKNGGIGTIGTKTMTYGKSVKLPANKFKKKGYTFVGWATSKANAKKLKVAYTDKQKVKNLSKKNNATVTLYATWVKNNQKFKVTYKLNGKGAKNVKANKTKYTVTTKTFKLKNPTRKGYKFAGWYTKKSGGKKVSKISKGSYGNITLYARWKK